MDIEPVSRNKYHAFLKIKKIKNSDLFLQKKAEGQTHPPAPPISLLLFFPFKATNGSEFS